MLSIFDNNFTRVDEGATSLTLREVLSFFTGAEHIPPMGFPCEPSLHFTEESEFPMASTCALTLTLPTKHHNDYVAFRSKILFGFKNHGGFGVC